jgi:hypothetical protein
MLNSLVGIIASSGGAAGGGAAYESIASATGTGSSGTITFSSIPSTYTSLQIRAIMRSSATGTSISQSNLTFNSDSGNNYAQHGINGNGSFADVESYATGGYAGILLSGTVARAGLTSGIMGTLILDIHNYASTSQYKTIRSLAGGDANGSGRVALNSGLWLSTSAINSITLSAISGNWTTDTIISLYGIKGA